MHKATVMLFTLLTLASMGALAKVVDYQTDGVRFGPPEKRLGSVVAPDDMNDEDVYRALAAQGKPVRIGESCFSERVGWYKKRTRCLWADEATYDAAAGKVVLAGAGGEELLAPTLRIEVIAGAVSMAFMLAAIILAAVPIPRPSQTVKELAHNLVVVGLIAAFTLMLSLGEESGMNATAASIAIIAAFFLGVVVVAAITFSGAKSKLKARVIRRGVFPSLVAVYYGAMIYGLWLS